jgi:N-acetyl-1-D-myo-inositol-2-amino-2-deoxy-alpha-D-glucopyranoside deacetylase
MGKADRYNTSGLLMQKSYEGFRLLLVHAHPDDETINNGSTMAMYADLGAEVTLVTCTRGEEGEVLISDLAHFAAHESDLLGEHRVQELAAAMKALGVTDHRFLGEGEINFRDSGMMETEPNQRADNFWNADFAYATKLLVQVIDEVRPHVMITYDEIGGYGHPDHIQAHKVAMRAAELATEWQISKIYWNATPKSVLANGIAAMKEVGSSFFGAESVDDLPFAKADELVTAAVDANEYVDAKMAAMKAHATQIELDGPFFALSNQLGLQVWGHEYYSLVKGDAHEPFNSDGRETDLFAGIVL